jgi:hypothetical protein
MKGFHPFTPLKPFLKKGFENPKNFIKDDFFKITGWETGDNFPCLLAITPSEP